MTEFASLRIVDAHVHLYSPRNIEKLMDKARGYYYSAANVASLSQCGEDRLAQNAVGMLWKARHPADGFFFGGLEYHRPGELREKIDPAAQVRRLIDIGCDGIKMLEGKPTVRKDLAIPLDSPMYDEFYSFLQERRIPVLSHVADPEEFWDAARVPAWAVRAKWFYGDGTFVSQQQLFDETKRVLRKFPRLNVFFAHFFFHFNDPRAARGVMEEFPNVRFDICPGIEMFWTFTPHADQWREFFVRYQDRIIFGTDMHDRGSEEEVSRMECVRRFLETDDEFDYRGNKDHPVRGIKLDNAVLGKIYDTNFQRVGCVRPRPLDVPAAIEYCREQIERVRGVKDAAVREKLLDELTFVVGELGTRKGRSG